jgi:hypothetical protein
MMHTDKQHNPIAPFHLLILEGRGMNAKDANMTLADPYVQARLKGLGHLFNSEKQSTPVVQNNSNPVWNWSFLLHPTKPNDVIDLRVYDKDAGKDTLIGKALITVSEFLNRGPVELWLPLYAKKKLRLQNADLHVVIDYGQNAVSIDQNRYQIYGNQVPNTANGGLIGGHLPLYNGPEFWNSYQGPVTTGGIAQPLVGQPGFAVVNVPTEAVREVVTTHVTTTTGDRIGRDHHLADNTTGTTGTTGTSTSGHHGLFGHNKDTTGTTDTGKHGHGKHATTTTTTTTAPTTTTTGTTGTTSTTTTGTHNAL